MAPNRNNVVSVGLLRERHGEANRANRTSRATRWSNALTDVVTSARTQTVTVGGGFLCSQGRGPSGLLREEIAVCPRVTISARQPLAVARKVGPGWIACSAVGSFEPGRGRGARSSDVSCFCVFPVVDLKLDALHSVVHEGQSSARAVAGHHSACEQNSPGACGFDAGHGLAPDYLGVLPVVALPLQFCGSDIRRRIVGGSEVAVSP